MLDAELARCDREIAAIKQEALNGNPDVRGIIQGLYDWRTEKKLILSTRTSLPNGDAILNSNTEKSE